MAHFWNSIHLVESVEGSTGFSTQDVNQHTETYKLDCAQWELIGVICRAPVCQSNNCQGDLEFTQPSSFKSNQFLIYIDE